MSDIFNIPQEEILLIGESNSIYGYPLISGLKNISNEIVNIMKYQKIKYVYGIDLGCGDGQTIKYFNTHIDNSEWVGIELSEYRISLGTESDKIINGNLLDIDYGEYNFIYTNNLVFDDELSKKLEIKIYNEFSGIIITTKPLEYGKLIANTRKIKIIKADTNWEKDKEFFFYLRLI